MLFTTLAFGQSVHKGNFLIREYGEDTLVRYRVSNSDVSGMVGYTAIRGTDTFLLFMDSGYVRLSTNQDSLILNSGKIIIAEDTSYPLEIYWMGGIGIRINVGHVM